MTKIRKITPAIFKQMVLAEAKKLDRKLFEDDAYKALSDPLEAKMNQNDKLGDSDKAVVYKGKGKEETKKGKAPITVAGDVKMNAEAKEEGSDKKAATAVSVKAGSEKSKTGTSAGQKTANFESKKENPKKEVSKPFIEKASEKQNTLDKLTDETTKTYVEAGAKKTGSGVTAGQHKATEKEKAPVVKDKEAIAKGIQTDMGNSNNDGSAKLNAAPKLELKESYSKKDLINKIRTEAVKIAKKTMLEAKLKQIDEELKNL